MKHSIRQALALLLAVSLLGQIIPASAAATAPDGSVAIEAANFPDAQFRQWLLNPANVNGYGADGVFTPEELAQITAINVSGTGISSLEGISVFHALESLSCMNNRLTALDVQSNRNLRYLQCAFNRIKSLDVSGLDQLISLICESNGMESLDTTGCTALEILYCRNNNLPAVEFTTNTALKFIESFDNRLTTIDLSTLTALEFVHLDHNRLTSLDLSHNGNLSPIGSGFVARNNWLDTLTLPTKPDLLVDPDVYAEQDPKAGYERVNWYSDPTFTQPITGPVSALGQTLYAQWLPNDYIYSDVCETDWYYADVQYVSSHRMMQGYADGRFDPEGRLTRSQLAQILYNLEGRPAVNGTDRFYDTDPNAWYSPAMAWAVESGILTGYGNGNIGPNDPVTREQLAVMLLRYAQLNGLEVDGRADLSGYADSSAISGYALEAMAWANAAGIVQGSGGKLLPGDTTSRAQTAAMLTRFSRQLPTV